MGISVYWFLAALDIALRIIAFRRTTHRVFGWFLAFTIFGECILFWLGWTHKPESSAYDLTWRGYELMVILGLALVTREAIGSNLDSGQRTTTGTEPYNGLAQDEESGSATRTPNRNPENSQGEETGRVRGRPHGTGRNQKVSVLCSLVLTIIAVFCLHHANRWPSFWLEPILTAICAANLFFGIVIIFARRWTPHGAILCEWLMFNGILYSGAAISPREVGLAGEILNCITFAAWSFI